ncbi:MAG: hypothetical protein QM484_01950 [Woeseiaceae bacterium]
MCNIRDRLLVSINDDSLFETTYQLCSENRGNHTAVGKELALLHNQKYLNALTEFIKLKKEIVGHKFFTIRQALDGALPEIDAPVLDVMKCVKHLTEQAGQVMDDGLFFSPFTAYCQANNERPDVVLDLAIDQHEDWKYFIFPAIVAGARINLKGYVGKAIELTTEQNVEISSLAISALGRINYDDHVDLVAKVLKALKLVTQSECDDQLFSDVLRASYQLYLADKTKEILVSDLIAVALVKRGCLTLNSASKLFMFEKNALPDSIIDHLLKAFEDVNPEQIETLNNIDYGLKSLLEKDQEEKVINFLEVLLIKNGSSFSVSKFDSVGHALLKNQNNILSKTITRWLMSDVVWLGRSAFDLINDFGGKKNILSADLKQLEKKSDGAHFFLAKKACGWLFLNPIPAVSFIVSLIDSASDGEMKSISEILFNPLLISYSGSVKEYLQNLPEESSKKVKNIVAQLLADLDDYHEGLQSTRNLKEFEPSVSQREAYYRKNNREMSESYKEVQKGSFLGQMFFGKTSVLLYGNSSIHYIYNGPDGEKSRQEIPLQSIKTSFEFPSLQMLAPLELEMKLRNFRLEGCIS